MGSIGELSDDYKVFDRCFIWAEEKFTKIVVGETKISHYPSQFGPEVSFCKTMQDADATDRKIYIIKYSASGTGLHPNSSKISFYPYQNENKKAGSAFVRLVNTSKNAMKHLNNENIPFSLSGFIWIHGEQDSKDPSFALDYQQNLMGLIEELNKELDFDATKIVLPLPLPNSDIQSEFPERETVRNAFKLATEELVQKGFDVSLLETDDVTTLKDNLHYNTNGQIILGEKIAKVFTNE